MDTKPASDVLAGAVARAASQGTIHPLDTLKVRMQHGPPMSKIGKLIPPAGAPSFQCIRSCPLHMSVESRSCLPRRIAAGP